MEKDFRPIWIYLLISFVGTFIGGFILGAVSAITGKEFESFDLLMLLIEFVIIIIFIVLYRKKLQEDFYSLTKKDWLIIIGIGLLTTGVNFVLSELINLDNDNQNTVIDLLETYPVITSFITVLVAPIIEEFVFRYSFSTFIKNKWVYLAVTSILFGLIHTTSFDAVIYIFVGFVLGFVYLKYDKKISAPIIIHIINNLISVVMVLLGI